MMKVTPNCRYGHGNLAKVDTEYGRVFGYQMPDTPGAQFTGVLFICLECGYTEFFDDEIGATKVSVEKMLNELRVIK